MNNNMANNILKQNKIPGSEQLTRPEEIGALSKYLGEIKKVQDEHTKLDDRVLEVAGRMDKARFPEIEKLDDSVEILENSQNASSLNNNISELPNSKAAFVEKLNNTIIPGAKNEGNNIQSLDNSVANLKEENKVTSLNDSIATLTADNKVELDNSVANLTDENKVTSLNDSIVTLSADNKVELDNSVANLKIPEEVSLDSAVAKLNNVSDKIKSNDNIEKLEVNTKVDKLSDKVENLQGLVADLELDKTIVRKSANQNNEVSKLDSNISNLANNQGNSPTSLDNSSAHLEVSPIAELNSSITSLSGNLGSTVSELDKFIEGVPSSNTQEISSLNNQVEELEVNKLVKELNKTKSPLNVESKIDSLATGVYELQADEKVTALNNLVKKLDTPETVKNLDTSISKLDINSIVKDLRNDVSELEVASKIESLVQSILIRPYDENLTKIKTALENTENLSADEAFSQVIKLFNDISEDGTSGLAKKLSGILTAYFLQPVTEGVPDADEKNRNRYLTFLEKLKEAVRISEVAMWESSSLSNNKISEIGDKQKKDKIAEKQKKHPETKIVPSYKLPNSRWPNLGSSATLNSVVSQLTSGNISLNGMDYVRFGLENLADASQLRGDLRHQMIKTALRAAAYSIDLGKRLLEQEPGRLPGTASAGPKGVIRRITNSLKSAAVLINDTNALQTVVSNSISSMIDSLAGNLSAKNRPKTTMSSSGQRTKVPTENYDNANGRKSLITGLPATLILNSPLTDLPVETAVEDYNGEFINFANNYMYSEGIQTTLLDLCKLDATDNKNAIPSTFEDLQKILRESPYITTPGKFGTTDKNEFRAQTLSVTNYWEILIEPFVNEQMNGGFSYLPAIEEINLINQKKHGVNTGYSEWIPFTGFDMTLSKMNTKSVGLYDGEIVYPVSSELTNELRISIADDMYFSWKWYFRTVSEVSVYNSIPHDKYYYEGTSVNYPIAPTYVDKTCHCVALYKNITFRIRIYLMTAQYSTIKSFDLLCVLKDYTETYAGDVDTAGTGDLTLIFSVVGENPDKYVPPVNVIDTKYGGVSHQPDVIEGSNDVNNTPVAGETVNGNIEGKSNNKTEPENIISKPSNSATKEEAEEGIAG